MKPKQIWANLAVKDIERTHKFYKKLGFKPNGAFSEENELCSFLVGQDNFVVHFFSKDSAQFRTSMGGEIADLSQGNEVIFSLSADSKKEVDQWAETVKKAGGSVFSKPQKIFQEGWYGYGFEDLDGHKWNVFYNGK